MEIRIGIRDLAREVTLESEENPDDVINRVRESLASGEPLVLVDAKGRQIIVPAQALGFVDLGAPERGRVGFSPL